MTVKLTKMQQMLRAAGRTPYAIEREAAEKRKAETPRRRWHEIEELAAKVRADREAGASVVELSATYEIGVSTVRRYCRAGFKAERPSHLHAHSDETKAEVLRLHAEGLNYAEIGRQLGMSDTAARKHVLAAR